MYLICCTFYSSSISDTKFDYAIGHIEDIIMGMYKNSKPFSI